MQLDGAGAEHDREGLAVLGERVVVTMLLEQGLGAGEDRLGPRPLVGGDAAREERPIDAEAEREPLDRLGGRARLPALDLRDVLLGEAVARELALGQARADPELPQPLAEPGHARRAGAGCQGRLGCHGRAASHPGTHSLADTSLGRNAPFPTSLKRGIIKTIAGQV